MRRIPETKRRARRILIAEDHDEFRQLLAESFRARHFEVTECRHGIELIGQLRCFDDSRQPCGFDLIISDIRMPGVSGMSVLEGLREFKDAPPLILITAFGDEQTHREAIRLGAVAIIDKPFDIDVLLAKADEVLTL